MALDILKSPIPSHQKYPGMRPSLARLAASHGAMARVGPQARSKGRKLVLGTPSLMVSVAISTPK